jgi:hypothetical protein
MAAKFTVTITIPAFRIGPSILKKKPYSTPANANIASNPLASGNDLKASIGEALG